LPNRLYGAKVILIFKIPTFKGYFTCLSQKILLTPKFWIDLHSEHELLPNFFGELTNYFEVGFINPSVD